MKTKHTIGAALITIMSVLSGCGPVDTTYTQEQIEAHDHQLAKQESGGVQSYEYGGGGGGFCYCNYCNKHHDPECL